MNRLIFSRLVFLFLFIISKGHGFAEENFLLINGATDITVFEKGPGLNERVTPCSTFKISLSLMGFDAGVLIDDKKPAWDFQEGYVEYLESWKTSQTPQSWMRNSCLWYSQVLAVQLGLEKIQNYLALLDYGNQDMSGGLTRAWVSSTLKISPKEQIDLIKKMIQKNLPISNHAIEMTKELLFIENLSEGWKLFGKTGFGSIVDNDGAQLEIGWFVGWIEKDDTFFPLAYNIRENKINLAQRIPRVKQLLAESNVLK